ncbi:MAG: dehydrogenase E1 component subunit alpha/beta [Acidobacteria bacterium]|nr:dehydrogenase E1 component subunit alpha/beta [Acidobacteriota bacterium]
MNPVRPPQEKLLDMYRLMQLARRFDESVIDLYASGQIPGFMHLYVGEEAVAVGACAALAEGDTITSTHRGHGHCIAKGGDPRFMMAELFARANGYCRGKGGSMHIANLSLGILGANGIVGGGFPIANGAALTSQMRATGRVAVCFFGDGASNEGTFHEAANLAAVWKLPVLFVCENNGYAQTTPQREHQAIGDIVVRAAAYGMPGCVVDGMDVLAVHAAVAAAVADARGGKGPSFIECKTYRYRGHWEGDPQPYRTPAEIAEWKKRDCISSFGGRLVREFGVRKEELSQVREQVERQMAEAIAFARSSPPPQPETVLTDVYSSREPSPRAIRGPTGRMTIRQALNGTLDRILAAEERALLFGEDIGLLGGAFSVTKGLFARYGGMRVRNTPISESAIIGAAIGASVTGLLPIAEIMFCDFLYVAMDQIVNQMAKMKYMYGGDARLPIVVRCTCGSGFSAAAQHSQSNEAMFMHVPGLKILMPSTPDDAAGLLLSAFEDPNPVLFFEHKGLYDETGEVSGEPVPIGKARIVREGGDITVVTYGKMRKLCEAAAGTLAAEGIAVEVIDLRSLLPFDAETVLASVRKTGRVAIVHEAPLTAGAGAELAAVVAERAFGSLRAPVTRIAGLDVPMPFAPVLESAAVPSAAGIAERLRAMVR